jgi:hypothetical protein
MRHIHMLRCPSIPYPGYEYKWTRLIISRRLGLVWPLFFYVWYKGFYFPNQHFLCFVFRFKFKSITHNSDFFFLTAVLHLGFRESVGVMRWGVVLVCRVVSVWSVCSSWMSLGMHCTAVTPWPAKYVISREVNSVPSIIDSLITCRV